MALQRISFQSVPVDDQDRALAFYRDILGLDVQVDAPYEDGWRWIFMKFPGSPDRLQFARRGEVTMKDRPLLALVSDDVDAECARWAGLGVTIANAPQDAPWAHGVRWAMIRDSEDNVIFVESAK